MRLASLLVTLVLSAATDAFAQEQAATPGSYRAGAWFGVGVTYGQMSGFAYASDAATAGTLNVRVGGTISPHFRFGGELDLGLCAEGVIAALALVGTAYPMAGAGFFLKAGAGARAYSEWPNDYTDAVTDLIGIAGGGYDWRLGRRFSISPFLQVVAPLTNLATNGYARDEEWHMRLWQVGVSFTWH